MKNNLFNENRKNIYVMSCVSGVSINDTSFPCLRERKRSQIEKEQNGFKHINHHKQYWKTKAYGGKEGGWEREREKRNRAFTSVSDRSQTERGRAEQGLPSYRSQIYQSDHSLHSPGGSQAKSINTKWCLHVGTLSQGKRCPLSPNIIDFITFISASRYFIT